MGWSKVDDWSYQAHLNDQVQVWGFTPGFCAQDDLFKPNFYLSLMEFRALNLARLQAFARQRFMSVADYMADPLRFQAALESLSFCDYSLAIKAGVRALHIALWSPDEAVSNARQQRL